MKTPSLKKFEFHTKLAFFRRIPNSNILHCHIVSHDYTDVALVREFYHTLRAITDGQPSPMIFTGVKLRHTSPIVRRMVKYHILPLVSYTTLVVPYGLNRLYGFMCRMIAGDVNVDLAFASNIEEALSIMTEAEKFHKKLA